MADAAVQMDNVEVARVLEEVAELMELNGDNPFRARAYANAARTVETMDASVVGLSERGELEGIKGIGKKLAAEIKELVDTGALERHKALVNAVPPGLIEMQQIPGLGGKKLRTVHEELGVSDIDALAEACESGAVEELKGFGKKTAQNILKGIAYVKDHRGRFLSSVARSEAERLKSFLEERDEVVRVEVTGSIRRRGETTKDVDVVASATDAARLADAFVKHPAVKDVTAKGETKVSVLLKSGMSADLRIVTDAQFPYAVHHFTGSKEHNTKMRGRAKERGMKMNEYGLFKGDDLVPCKDEAEIFEALGLAFIEPELREGLDEIEWAENDDLPELVTLEDLTGSLHVHSTYSDGRASIEQMAKKAQSLGHTYLAMCDHSKAAAYAGGLDEARVRTQWEEIDAVNETLDGFRVLKGIEVDILGDGGLDFEDAFLAEFDLVVASIHSVFSMTEAEATKRVLKAVESPHVDIIGHPTGRLLLIRDGYPLNVREVIDGAAEHGTALELNAHPRRLDLDWRHLRYAREKGVLVAVNTDAHSLDELEHMTYGLGIARKAGLTRDDVLNTKSLDALLDHVAGG